MDRLSFKKEIVRFGYSEKAVCAKIFINDIPLLDIVKEYELPYAKQYGQENIAGGYMSIYARYLFELLTGKAKSDEYGNEIPVLICDDCGTEGCWDLLMTVMDERADVIWTHFHNPHRSFPDSAGGYWNYDAFPSYRFDKEQYRIAIRELEKIVT